MEKGNSVKDLLIRVVSDGRKKAAPSPGGAVAPGAPLGGMRDEVTLPGTHTSVKRITATFEEGLRRTDEQHG